MLNFIITLTKMYSHFILFNFSAQIIGITSDFIELKNKPVQQGVFLFSEFITRFVLQYILQYHFKLIRIISSKHI